MRCKVDSNPLDIIKGTEVMDEGRRVVRPDVMQFLVQAASLSQLVKMRKLEESKVPAGTASLNFTANTTIKKILLHVPWISFALVNDGAGKIKVAVNDETELLYGTEIDSGETYTLDCVYPVIRVLYIQTVSGTATVRIRAKVGKQLLDHI